MPRKKPPALYAVGAGGLTPKAEQMIQQAASEEALRFVEAFGPIKAKCESPIEEVLMAALYIASKICEETIHFMPGGSSLPDRPFFDQTAFIYQQIGLGQYRVDIAIHDATLPFEIGEPRIMIVECDGHDFHERTKEQARRDKQRDRFLQSRGFKVLRFTGSEIWADPDQCADEIINELRCNDDWRNRDK